MMRTILVPLAIAAMMPFAAAADAKPDFSGEWKLNVDKSNFGPMPPPESETRTIAHADPALSVKSVRVGGTGDVTTDLKFTTDGKESVNTIKTPAGEIEMKTTMNWEGNALVGKSKLVGIPGHAPRAKDIDCVFDLAHSRLPRHLYPEAGSEVSEPGVENGDANRVEVWFGITRSL